MGDKVVRIGCSSGFWGDSMVGAPQLVASGGVDYLVADYLAEITMSIMARARAKDPAAGYATDFVTVTMARLLRDIAARRIRVVTNAGGVNPVACGQAIRKLAAEQGVALKVAVVSGDDLLPRADEFRAAFVAEQGFVPDKFMSMNAYLGAFPIAAALAAGADIVITGRCVDSALALGPLIHEFGWQADDWDRLAAGSLAGHIIECGAQATGGIHTDWADVPDWENIGYPIVSVAADGSFTVGKPAGTGGIVTRGTVAEQLVYEIGDPASYLLPDVTCDFSAVTVQETGESQVRVAGARGRPPTGRYKVSATYMDGFRAVAHLTIGGVDAVAKAERTAAAILARTRKIFASVNLADYRDTLVEVLGAEASYGPHANPAVRQTREAVLKLAVSHLQKLALEIFAREVAPAGTSFSPGTTGYFGGRPSPQPVVRLYTCFVAKAAVPIALDIDGAAHRVEIATTNGFTAAPPAEAQSAPLPPGPRTTVPLIRLAFGRSGDKGNHSNIGIIAREPRFLSAIRPVLTAEAVQAWMAHTGTTKVERFDLPGVHGLNFLLHDSLGGGGIASLRNDPQGKAHAQMLLEFPVEVPSAWLT